MSFDWVTFINAYCPLEVDWIAWEAPTLIIRGKGWSFTCTSTWRLVDAERMIIGCEDDTSAEMLDFASRSQIIRCEAMTSLVLGDLRIVFENGTALEVFVASAIDPWVFRLPDGPSIIPSPTDPRWNAAPSR